MKKSENVEIRIDLETKQALYEKTEREARSVSDVLRSLIQSYLDAPSIVSSSKSNSTKRAPLKQLFGWAAASMALIFSGVMLIPAASADNLKLEFRGEVLTQEGDGSRLRTSDYVVEFDEKGDTVSLPIGSSGIVVEISAKAVALDNDLPGANMKLKIVQLSEIGRVVIAEPVITGRLDEISRIEIGSENETMYTIEIVPSEISSKELD